MWDHQNQLWLDMMEKLPLRKMDHSEFSTHHGTKVATFLISKENQQVSEWHGLKKRWMPLPNVVLMFPDFRYVPW